MTENQTQPDSGREAFIEAFRRHAAGVAVVTSVTPDGTNVGFTATSLASLAATPPMATFNMAQVSTAWPAMYVGNRAVIHMLGSRTRHLAQLMAGDHDVRFSGEQWHPGPHGLPVLEGVTAWMIGRIVAVHPVRENAVVVVEVEGGGLGELDDALLYHQRQYLRPGSIA